MKSHFEKDISKKSRPRAQHNEGGFISMLQKYSGHFRYRVLLIYLPSVWTLLIRVFYIIYSATQNKFAQMDP